MRAYDFLGLIVSSLWIPIAINILVSKKLGVKRRVICAVLESAAYSSTMIVKYSEISALWLFPALLLIVYLGMGKSKTQLLYVPIAYIIIVISSYLAEWGFELADISTEQIENNLLFTIVLLFGITLIVILISILFKSLSLPYMELIEGVSKETGRLLIYTIILCTLVFLVNGWEFRKMGFPYEMRKIIMLTFFMYTILTIGITLFMFRIIKSQVKMKQVEEEKRNLIEYTYQVESMYNELRSFKHDYVNILSSLSGFIENKDMSGLEDYFEHTILPTNGKMNQTKYQLQKLSKILNPAIKGLVSTKMIYAINAGLDVFIDIMENVSQFSIRTLDLTRILGIYIDNAIEAALESEQKELKFNIIKEESSVIIVVINSFVDQNLSVKEMEKYNISTKGEGRGIGLNNVSEILKKYPNIFRSTEMKDGYFVQTLVLNS